IPARPEPQSPGHSRRLAQELAALPRAGTHHQRQTPAVLLRLPHGHRRRDRGLSPLPRAIQNAPPPLTLQYAPLLRVRRKPEEVLQVLRGLLGYGLLRASSWIVVVEYIPHR